MNVTVAKHAGFCFGVNRAVQMVEEQAGYDRGSGDPDHEKNSSGDLQAMNVTVAKHAGFCFGVNRAVQMVEEQARTGNPVYTLGPIIHNRHAVARFAPAIRCIPSVRSFTTAMRWQDSNPWASMSLKPRRKLLQEVPSSSAPTASLVRYSSVWKAGMYTSQMPPAHSSSGSMRSSARQNLKADFP